MPPPGVPDWVFPGAVIIALDRGGRPLQNRSPAGHWVITNLDLMPNGASIEVNIAPSFVGENGRTVRDDRFETLSLDDLLADWQPTGEWLYARAQPPTAPNEAVQALQFYRWSDGPLSRILPAPPIQLVFVMRVAAGLVVFDTVADEVEHRVSLDHFHRELANGNAEFLGHEAVFSVPRSMEDMYRAGDLFLDSEGREFFLTYQTREAGRWAVRAAHDLSDCGPHYIQDAQRQGNEEPVRFDDIPDFDDTAELDYPMLGEEGADPVPDEYEDDDPYGPSMIQVGDRWHFDAPNEGLWTVTARHEHPTRRTDLATNEFRSEDGSRMSGNDNWVIANGRRLTPPDSRFTGEPIAPRQVWEIPTNQTRRTNSRWRVTKVATQASISMVSLEPEVGQGAQIFWPEVRLRAQGRLVSDGLVRRTAFERVLGEDEDS